MPRTARRAQVSLLALAAVIVMGCGSDEKRATAATGNTTDRAFVAGMVPHHEMGVEMARMASERSHDPELASWRAPWSASRHGRSPGCARSTPSWPAPA